VTDEEEFAARSQLKWQRDDDVWILLYRRKRMGRLLPDKDHPGMWRSVKSNGLSDIADLSWAKDAVLAQAVRELAYEAAHTPSKPQQNRWSGEQKSDSGASRGHAQGWLTGGSSSDVAPFGRRAANAPQTPNQLS
jgi:hypothetical protein